MTGGSPSSQGHSSREAVDSVGFSAAGVAGDSFTVGEDFRVVTSVCLVATFDTAEMTSRCGGVVTGEDGGVGSAGGAGAVTASTGSAGVAVESAAVGAEELSAGRGGAGGGVASAS